MIIRKIKTNIKTNAPIIDIEIRNDIKSGGRWLYEESDIITLGLIEGNEVTIIQREKEDSILDFKEKIKEIVGRCSNHHAFNINMEQGGLKGFLGEIYIFNEISPWKGRGWNKDKFFEEVLKLVDKVEDKINMSIK